MNKVIYLVPTPIGNLEDITLRALRVLNSVDVILCEDTRHTLKLLNHFGIRKRLLSFEKFSEARRIKEVLELLDKGKSVAMVSNAGVPGISDPGVRLVSIAHEMGIKVEALPGACAFVTAISGSGLTGPVRFIEFFPRKKGLARKEIARMAVSEDITIFYESPGRIIKTLTYIYETLDNRRVCVARELTKIFEEYIIGSIPEVIARLKGMNNIGEVTVLIGGIKADKSLDSRIIEDRARFLLNAGYSKKDALDVLIKETGSRRNKIYEMLLEITSNNKD
ncbi:MAG: 16S rRNA (cytidine(1402)-2'-O)-methyltransferase [Thermodesulfobacteriota bacterium]|nr:16S rRNA (cytidine(1402)-2'-O)-methyltransferase [Thermodesulfobacteriota bacterium]